MSRRLKKILFFDILIVIAVIAAAVLYVKTYYHAADEALHATKEYDGVTISRTIINSGEEVMAYMPDEYKAGLIFYPGRKVQYEAYAPLMKALVDDGVACIMIKMPGNMANFDSDAASDAKALLPEVEEWYIGGHDIGGTAAAKYLSENAMDYEGLILLGSYSTTDLSTSGVRVLSVYGSEDKILSEARYEKNRPNIAEHLMEHVIDGGCHSYFGMYGLQRGDGEPAISNQEQIDETAAIIAAFMSY